MTTKINIVILMVAFSVMSYFDRTIMSVAGPVMMREFGLSETQMGTVYSAFLLGYALMMIPAGYFVDRWGPWRSLIGMGFGAALFTGLTSLGAKPGLGSWIGVVPALISIRFLMGLCTAPLYPACGRMNANWFPVGRQGLVWGIVAGGAGIGSALSPSLFAWMIPNYGWPKSFWLAGGATAVLAGIWAWYVRDRPSEHRAFRNNSVSVSTEYETPTANTGSANGIKKALGNRNVVLLALGYMTVGYFEYIFFFWIYYYFSQVRRMTPGETSVYSSVIFLAWVVMTPLGGWLSDWLIKNFGKKRGMPIVPVGGVLSSALLLYWGTHVDRSWAVGGLLAISFGLASATDGPYWAATIDAGKQNVGSACGVLNTGSNIGGFVAPILTPIIASFAGWSAALGFGCAVVAMGAVIWFLLDVSSLETRAKRTQPV